MCYYLLKLTNNRLFLKETKTEPEKATWSIGYNYFYVHFKADNVLKPSRPVHFRKLY